MQKRQHNKTETSKQATDTSCNEFEYEVNSIVTVNIESEGTYF